MKDIFSVLNQLFEGIKKNAKANKPTFEARLARIGKSDTPLPEYCLDLVTSLIMENPVKINDNETNTMDRQSFDNWQSVQKVLPGKLVNPFDNSPAFKVEPNQKRKALIEELVSGLEAIAQEEKHGAELETKKEELTALLENSPYTPEQREAFINETMTELRFLPADKWTQLLEKVNQQLQAEGRSDQDLESCLKEVGSERDQIIANVCQDIEKKIPAIVIPKPEEEADLIYANFLSNEEEARLATLAEIEASDLILATCLSEETHALEQQIVEAAIPDSEPAIQQLPEAQVLRQSQSNAGSLKMLEEVKILNRSFTGLKAAIKNYGLFPAPQLSLATDNEPEPAATHSFDSMY